jgi:hypothetical protein
VKSFAFDAGLVRQHDGNVVPNWIDAMARGTFQAALIGSQFHAGFAYRADENFEQFV